MNTAQNVQEYVMYEDVVPAFTVPDIVEINFTIWKRKWQKRWFRM